MERKEQAGSSRDHQRTCWCLAAPHSPLPAPCPSGRAEITRSSQLATSTHPPVPPHALHTHTHTTSLYSALTHIHKTHNTPHNPIPAPTCNTPRHSMPQQYSYTHTTTHTISYTHKNTPPSHTHTSASKHTIPTKTTSHRHKSIQ